MERNCLKRLFFFFVFVCFRSKTNYNIIRWACRFRKNVTEKRMFEKEIETNIIRLEEEKTNENGEEESDRRNGKRDYEGSSKPSNALPPKRRCLVKVDIISCLSLS